MSKNQTTVTKDHAGVVQVGYKTMTSTSIATETLLSFLVVCDPLDSMFFTEKQQGLSIVVAFGKSQGPLGLNPGVFPSLPVR